MARFKSDFLQTISDRGFIHQGTDLEGLDEQAAAGAITAYIGYDATGDSLHVGHLVSIMLLRWFQKTGHKPIVLMGGGTTRVGDPSGKDDARKLLTDEQISENLASIKSCFEQYLTFGDGPTDAIMVNNDDWLRDLNYIDFLRDVGRHFSVNRMLTFDSVRMRLEREQPLSFLEFNYMILQAYDFMELAKRYNCKLQMGGSDQWGNIVNGIELARRSDGAELFGVTVPLITTASGAKMGKTADGAVWLNENRLSAFDYWQFWRNTEDADVGRFLKLFTDLPLDEIARLESLQGAEINEAKKLLADAATALARGASAAREASEAARKTFEENTLAATLPTVDIPAGDLQDGIGVLALLTRTGLTASNSEARRMIKGGGVKLNDARIDDDSLVVTAADLGPEGVLKLSMGKKKHVLIRVG
ncbi:MAG: tyrosine--tRNA ligase [Alphaproteobacteria bacterium]